MSLILILSDDAKETMLFVCDSSREKDSARLREKIPLAIKLKRRSIRPHERFDKIAADRIVIVDEAVPKIADPKFVALHESKSHGALRFPFEIRRLTKLPLVSNTLIASNHLLHIRSEPGDKFGARYCTLSGETYEAVDSNFAAPDCFALTSEPLF